MQQFKDTGLSDRLFVIINHTLLALLTLIFFYPLWYCLVASFSDPGQLLSNYGMIFWPLGYSLEGYRNVFINQSIWTGYANTLFYVVVGTGVNMLLTLLGAYTLSRKELMLRMPLSLLLILTMYVDAGIIPNFLLVRDLGLYNSRWAIILMAGVGTYNLIVMRTAFSQVPRSLEEAAEIDGANDWQVLWHVLLPVSKATIAVIILFYAVGHWNSWFAASIYLRDRDKFPLQMFLREILIAASAASTSQTASSIDGFFYMEELVKYCTIVVSTLPILCIYPFVQKYFVSGIMLGSLKE